MYFRDSTSTENKNKHYNHSKSIPKNSPMQFLIPILLFLVCGHAWQPPVGGTEPIDGDSPLEKCDITAEQLLIVKSIDLAPNPPHRGENLTIAATGDLKKFVKSGSYVDVEVRLGLIRLLTQRFDLCETLDDNDVEGLECPLETGNYKLHKKVQIPDAVPPGKYTVLARAYNQDDELLTCLTGDVVFPPA